MAFIHVGTKYIKRQWDFENFLIFWCTLTDISVCISMKLLFKSSFNRRRRTIRRQGLFTMEHMRNSWLEESKTTNYEISTLQVVLLVFRSFSNICEIRKSHNWQIFGENSSHKAPVCLRGGGRGEYFSLSRDRCPCLIFFSSCSYIQIRCFVQKYWSRTATRNTDMWRYTRSNDMYWNKVIQMIP